MFLLGAFLTGGAVGYAVTRSLSPMVVGTPPILGQLQLRESWKKQLELTPEQIKQFDALYDARKVPLDSIRALYRPATDSIAAIYRPAIDSILAIYAPAMDSLRTTNHKKVMQLLDSSQKVKYQHMIEADKQRADSAKKAGVMK